ncbi:MAG: MoxR family ATPase [Lentisphaerae bacterium]|nr:MoxR family ATPase [Lentisphaerota bacterium]MCP4101699.1 MoxR family ATPase [Lentisphaerota bacterium]
MNYLRQKLDALKETLGTVIKGKPKVITLLITALGADGNVLMEDVPGVGKTTLAKALAASIEGKFSRIQFTPDLLPSDILGNSIYNPQKGEFFFRPGPVFANILVADEINRASPRTQSALLECMSERQVSLEGKTNTLPKPFMVIATENPIEYQGTYPLPEAQLDRFAMQLKLGYPEADFELEIMFDRKESDPADRIVPVMNCDEIYSLQQAVRSVDIERSIGHYMLSLIRATRTDSKITLGASPRALILLSRCAQAYAFIAGREYVLPDDVKALAEKVLAHRLVIDNKAKYSGITAGDVIAEIIDRTKVPS